MSRKLQNRQATQYRPGCQLVFAALFSLLVLHANVSQAAENDVVRVEEDWELVLTEPSDAKTCPQFETAMSPHGHADADYARVTWNYREFDTFHGAGLQVQTWHGDQLQWHRSVSEQDLSNTAEGIIWTQALETDGTTSVFRIINGQSTTWGSFGGDDTAVQLAKSVANLNGYTTGTSTANCQITYGLNRVSLLRIKEVRRYRADGELISVDSEPKLLYSP
ncbi:MAG: hypothetical protein OES79_09490 [Planctomycetota bacterium]|nr:hypothetical protein [Planctomycetota bacterium]